VSRDDDDTERYGMRLEGLIPGHQGDARSLPAPLIEAMPSAMRELGVAAAVAAVVLPVYSLAWPLFNHPVGPRHLPFAHDPVATLLGEVVAVASPRSSSSAATSRPASPTPSGSTDFTRTA
jgi:hypothetical protein